MTHTLLLVGHGKMGGVLLERLRNTAIFSAIHVISPNHTQKNSGIVSWHRDLASVPADFSPSVITLAVKPALLETILPHYAGRFATALYVSVAAGKTLAFYQKYLGAAHIVRAMPNTPSLVGEGMTALCAANTLSAAARATATSMMQAIGEILWVEDESQMDAVTALSGCGPAYVFLFMDALIKAAIHSGLTGPDAKKLALQTVKGSVALASTSPKSLEELCAQVASPGGATEAALKQLKNNDALHSLMQKAIDAAIARTREMAQ